MKRPKKLSVHQKWSALPSAQWSFSWKMVQEHIWEEILGYPLTLSQLSQPRVLMALLATILKFDDFVVRTETTIGCCENIYEKYSFTPRESNP